MFILLNNPLIEVYTDKLSLKRLRKKCMRDFHYLAKVMSES